MLIDYRKIGSNFLYDQSKKQYYDKYTNQYLGIGSRVIVRLTDVNKINNTFKVKVIGMPNTNVKKKTLEK